MARQRSGTLYVADALVGKEGSTEVTRVDEQGNEHVAVLNPDWASYYMGTMLGY
jgi:hypothetical protein